jgi:hypothetical protein
VSGPTKAERLSAVPDDLDAHLPDLRQALEPTAAAARFTERWPGPGRPPTITSCALLHVRWAPGVSGEASYRLSLGPPTPDPGFTIGVVTVTPGAVNHRLFTDDADLPGLAEAADLGVVGPWLAEQSSRRTAPCAVVPVRYRSGRRCVLRYEWRDEPPVYGKVLAGSRAGELATVLRSLGGDLVAPVVGVSPRWQLVVQHDLGVPRSGSPSDDDSHRDGDGPHTCGRLLGSLHARAGPAGAPCSLTADADGLRRHLPVMRRMSASAEAFAAEIERLGALADPLASTVPSHGAFRLDQVIVGRAGPRLVDLDSYCHAEPERDIGNLLAYLRWRALRRPGFDLHEAASSFLAGYGHTAPSPCDDRRVAVYEGASLLKIAARRYRRLAVDEWARVPELLAAARDRLDAGSRR